MAKIIKPNFGKEKEDRSKLENDNKSDSIADTVKLELSLDEKDENIISDVQRETLLDELNSFPPIDEGRIDVVGVYAFDMGDSWEVKAFLRNGINKPINFEKVAFLIKNPKNEVLAAQAFDMQDAGNLPPHTARPYKLNFDKSNVYVKNIPADDWYIIFDNNVGTVEYQNFGFGGQQDTLSENSQSILNRFLENLPKVQRGQYDFSKFSIGINEDGELIISVVVRNGFNLPLSIEKLPVTIINEEGSKVFSTIFEVQNFEVKPGEAKLLNLNCNIGIKLNKDMDLSNWELIFKS